MIIASDVPPFIPVENRGQALANLWWLSTGQKLNMDRPAAKAALEAIADSVERERAAVEVELRASIAFRLSEHEGDGLTKPLIEYILGRSTAPEKQESDVSSTHT